MAFPSAVSYPFFSKIKAHKMAAHFWVLLKSFFFQPKQSGNGTTNSAKFAFKLNS